MEKNSLRMFKNNDKIQIDNGKYRLIFDKSSTGELVLTIFDNSVLEEIKERTEEEKELKRKELDFVGQSSLTQDGTSLPATASEKNITQPDSDVNKIVFQKVFHGSPHNFQKFSTENIGSGEGAQAFGWGLYFTNQESIARFYAEKLANGPARISLIAKNDYLKSRKKSLRDVENKEKYEAKINKNITHFRKELKQAQKAGDESDIKFYEGLIDDSISCITFRKRKVLLGNKKCFRLQPREQSPHKKHLHRKHKL